MHFHMWKSMSAGLTLTPFQKRHTVCGVDEEAQKETILSSRGFDFLLFSFLLARSTYHTTRHRCDEPGRVTFETRHLSFQKVFFLDAFPLLKQAQQHRCLHEPEQSQGHGLTKQFGSHP
jgi:hypothetical protein